MKVDRTEDGRLKLTEEQIDQMAEKRSRKTLTRIAELTPQVEELRAKVAADEAAIEAGEREPLDVLRARIDVESGKLQSIEDEWQDLQARRAEYDRLESETASYRDRYEANVKDQAIASASAKHGALSVDVMREVLGPEVQIVDGKPTINGRTVDEHVAQMRADHKQYGALFKSNMARGVGQSTEPGKQASFVPSPARAARLPVEEYMRRRQESGRKGLLGF